MYVQRTTEHSVWTMYPSGRWHANGTQQQPMQNKGPAPGLCMALPFQPWKKNAGQPWAATDTQRQCLTNHTSGIFSLVRAGYLCGCLHPPSK